MAQRYQSQRIYSSSTEADYMIESSRCRYELWFTSDEVSLRGPGVDEVSLMEDLPEFLSHEDLAIYVVLMFENGLWPEEATGTA